MRVITTDGQTVEEQAVAVRAPGGLGSLGMLYNHAPLVTTVRPGVLSWRTPAGARRAVRVGDGLLEIAKNHLTLLTSQLGEVHTLQEGRA